MAAIIEYIRTHLFLILTIAVVLIILILVILSLFKKPTKSKTDEVIDNVLSLTKERNVRRFNRNYHESWVIFKRGIQDYYLYLFDKAGKLVFKSEMYASVLGAKSDLPKIVNSLTIGNYRVNKDLTNLYYAVYFSLLKKPIGMASKTSSIEGLENEVKAIKELAVTSKLDEVIAKDDSLYEYSFSQAIVPKKNHIENWKIRSLESEYDAVLYSEGGTPLIAVFPVNDKHEVKKQIQKYEDAIRSGLFVIDIDIDNKFIVYLRDFEKKTLAYSVPYENSEMAKSAIKEMILRA